MLSSSWRSLRFSQTFPVLLGTLAILLLAKAPGRLAGSPPPGTGETSPTQAPGGAPGSSAEQPSGGASNEPPEDHDGPGRTRLTSELPSRGGAHCVRAEKAGAGAAIVCDGRDPVLSRRRGSQESCERVSVLSRPASPFAPRAPPSPAVVIE